MTVEDMYKSGDETLVVRMVYNTPDPSVVAHKLGITAERWSGKTLSLGELVYRLSNTEKPEEVRVSPSFAAVEWYIPTTWGQYAWPFKTLEEYDLDKVEGFFRVTDKNNLYLNALPGLYKGFGIVVQTSKLDRYGPRLEVEEDVAPLLVFVDKRLEPRRTVVLIAERNGTEIKTYALTAYQPAVNALEQEGFTSPEEMEPIPGVKIYKLGLAESFSSKTDFEYYARSLSDKLLGKGIVLFKHYSMWNQPASKMLIATKA